MEKHQLKKSLYMQSNHSQSKLNCTENAHEKTFTPQKEDIIERAIGASQAAKNIIRLMNADYSDDQHDAILQAHLTALDTAVQFELLAEEFEPAKEVL